VKRIRVIPVLLLHAGDLVKTRRFRDRVYIGDPINAVRIFNEKRVDELILLDITERRSRSRDQEHFLADIVSEAFMPIAYGGGVTDVRQAERILKLGVEKVVINSAAIANPSLITEIARQFGSQSVVISIDARSRFGGRYRVYSAGARASTKIDPALHAKRMENAGAGEILITSVDREGTFRGYDTILVRAVADAVHVPVIACGGARGVSDFVTAVRVAHASAVAASSMFVFQGKHRAVLISFPEETLLRKTLFEAEQ
jgi:imidazole glycerol-phosphate synthase subunit HisF